MVPLGQPGPLEPQGEARTQSLEPQGEARDLRVRQEARSKEGDVSWMSNLIGSHQVTQS